MSILLNLTQLLESVQGRKQRDITSKQKEGQCTNFDNYRSIRLKITGEHNVETECYGNQSE